MSYLVDTKVLTALMKPEPLPRIIEWFDETPEEALHVSTLTLGELRQGLERFPAGRRKERFRVWLEHDLVNRFENRVLPVTAPIAGRWGKLVAESGRALPVVDGLLAATALHHELLLVTGSWTDFQLPGLEVFNLWMD